MSFSATLSGDPPFAYYWDLGDGVTSTAELPQHTYGASGTYAVTLNVENCEGAGQDEFSLAVTVDCSGPFKVYLPVVYRP